MKKLNSFYLIFILTILAIRTWVLFFPQKKLVLGGTIINHFWIGAVLMFLVLLLPKIYNKLRIVLLAVGLGLVADELIFLILGGGTVNDYWSIHSVLGAIAIAVIIFLKRKDIEEKI